MKLRTDTKHPYACPKRTMPYGDMGNNMRHNVIYLIIKHTSHQGIKEKAREIFSLSASVQLH